MVLTDLRGAKRVARQFLLPASISFSAIAASLLILTAAPRPFFWVLLLWGAILFAAIFRVERAWPRAILFNLGIVAILLAAAEAYFVARFRFIEFPPQVVTNGFTVPDDVLGWAPTKGMQAHAVEIMPGFHGPERTIYDVKYTIDSNGLRVAPPWRKDALAVSVLFFIDSLTFGYGLNDEETLPYQVGVQSGGRYRTFNFAFSGYSPAQMLGLIEHGMVRRVVGDASPSHAYYTAIADHVWRVAGRTRWIKNQPRYVLDADGTVQAAGFFDDPKTLAGLGRRVAYQLEKSAIWRSLDLVQSMITEDDIRLYLAMVRRSRDLLSAQYPGIEFRIILWPGRNTVERSTIETLRDGFRRMGTAVDLVEDILPGYTTDEAPFVLSTLDAHPNALANRLLARYVLNEMESPHNSSKIAH
jgi:hypothetical protein